MSVPPAAGAHRRRRPGSADRLATWLRRLRWPLVLAWLVAIVLLNPVASGLGRLTNDGASANLPASAQSTRVVNLQVSAQPGVAGSAEAIAVFARKPALTASDLRSAASARIAVARLAGRVRGLGPPGPLVRSRDRQAVYFAVTVTASPENQTSLDTAAVRAIRRAVAPAASAAGGGLQAAVTGSAAETADSGVSSKVLSTLRLTALGIIVVILILVYRRPLLWLLPLLGAIGAIIVAEAGAHGLASAGLTVSSLSQSILIVLVLGAASDYALLLVHRYREELRHHERCEDAMAAALRRTVPTLAASAGTVTCAMICLLAAESASLHGLGPVGAVSIVSALLAQTTFLPALLLVFGRVAFWPRAPRTGQPSREESRLWAGIGRRVARHPAPVALAAVVVLGGACAGLAALHISNDPVSSVEGHPGSVTGQQLLTEHYPPGAFDPLTVLTPPQHATAAAAAARSTPGVRTVTPAGRVGHYASNTVTLSVAPYGPGAATAVQALRDRLARDAPGSLVGGGPAIQYDITQAAHRDTLVLIPLVLVVIMIIIGLLLRAIVAPVVLVATTALSFAASFGLATLLWRYGLGFPGIEAQIPLYIFIFLVALGVDYNIFLSARIREEARRLGTRRGALRGLAVTGGVITAAGIVLAGTFADLARLPNVPVADVGIAVALGVLLDTLLVRTVLVPATMLSIGDRVWWPARAATARSAGRVELARQQR
jgi:RND superfamily putative drug exporter